MSYDIAFRCDSADSAYDLVHHAYAEHDDVRLVAYAVNGDTPAIVYDFAAEPVTTTTTGKSAAAKPKTTAPRVLRTGASLQSIARRTVDCPKPGCPGRTGEWCGNPKTGSTYGAGFMHTARKQAAKR